MIIRDARIALSALESTHIDIEVRRNRIYAAASRKRTRSALELRGYLILPGLINAHDHLEFNLFHRLGNGIYDNATAWAENIYQPNEAPLRQHLEVPKAIRLLWGGIKNLLNGVTSVSHHNPYIAGIFDYGFPVRVIKRFGWAHSLRFCSDIDKRFLRTPAGAPFIIHAAEGKDQVARNEIYELNKRGILGSSTVLVHAVGIQPGEIALVKNSGASIVWCPTSNYFTLDRTLAPEVLASGIPIALGSDSALTAEGDFFDELRAAYRHTTIENVYAMATRSAAAVLRLPNGAGSIQDGAVADLMVVPDHGQTPAEAIVSNQPELVMIAGRIKLVGAKIARLLNRRDLSGFEDIHVEGRGHYLIAAGVSGLKRETARYLGDSFRLAGKQVLA